MADRLTSTDIACWVLKSRTPVADIDSGWAPGTARELTRCLRRTYRVDLMRPGQPCLLWVSGQREPGVQAVGALTSPATGKGDGDEVRPEIAVTVYLTRLREPVPRSELLADPTFAGAEVLRMPAGSNPSYLSAERWDALLRLLGPDDLRLAGRPGATRR